MFILIRAKPGAAGSAVAIEVKVRRSHIDLVDLVDRHCEQLVSMQALYRHL